MVAGMSCIITMLSVRLAEKKETHVNDVTCYIVVFGLVGRGDREAVGDVRLVVALRFVWSSVSLEQFFLTIRFFRLSEGFMLRDLRDISDVEGWRGGLPYVNPRKVGADFGKRIVIRVIVSEDACQGLDTLKEVVAE
jgi:hypothetical protein